MLYRSWEQGWPVDCTAIQGMNQFEEVLLIDQEALKQSRWSTPVSYTGILDLIRMAFSKTEFAKDAGLKKGDFSYQSKQGKCTVCLGHGQLKTSMVFMSDLWLTCDACQGMRYNKTILACQLNGCSIGDVLRMTVEEAIGFFDGGAIVDKLDVLKRVGVGHLLLGQSAKTLSCGEAQRLKLATAMLKQRKGSTLYLFDEPSTGLHYLDILKLIAVFQSLVDAGDTVLFIEHNKTLIGVADNVITLGPGSGVFGGRVSV